MVMLVEDERSRLIELHGEGSVRSPTHSAIAGELPRNLVACDTGRTACGAFAVGSFKTTAGKRPPTTVASELERIRRVSAHGVGAVASKTCQTIKKELPRNLVACDNTREAAGAYAVGSFKTAAGKRPATTVAAEAERLRRVSVHGCTPVASKTCQTIKQELPRNLVACDNTKDAAGAYAVGAYKTAAGKRPPAAAAAEAERLRRVSIHGVAPRASKTCEAIKKELPRNLVACDNTKDAAGAYAVGNVVVPRVAPASGLTFLLALDKAAADDEASSESSLRASKSYDRLDLLSSSPTSVTALGPSSSFNDLRALARP